MGATAAIMAGATYFAAKSGKKQMKQNITSAVANATEAKAALTPPTFTPPPSALQSNIDASKAMTEAAQRYRRQKGGGFSSTILTSPLNQTPAPTTRKTLLGL